MNIGLWNIDHPETASGSASKEKRFKAVSEYLLNADCDIFIITEANAAIQLPNYYFELSDESPFKSSRRFYGGSNVYRQVAIYSKTRLQRLSTEEPINGLHCSVDGFDYLKEIYGNVITIKDQWCKTSSKTYADRLSEQIQAIQNLQKNRTLAGGDFNLRLGWPQKLSAHKKIKDHLSASGWVWPTELRNDTVQHVLHSCDLEVTLDLDFDIKYDKITGDGLSDHPFIRLAVSQCT